MELIKKGKEWYTPERNKMQMLFTKDDNVKRVIKERNRLTRYGLFYFELPAKKAVFHKMIGIITC